MKQAWEKVNLLQLGRVPVFGLAAIVCGLLFFQHQSWVKDPASELGVKEAQYRAARAELNGEQHKLAQGEDFLRLLGSQKIRVRGLASELDLKRASLKHSFDTDELVRWLAFESAYLHLKIDSTRVGAESKMSEDYASLPLTMTLQGTYGQVLTLLGRIQSAPATLRVSRFDARPVGNTSGKLVALEWKIDLTAYRLTD